MCNRWLFVKSINYFGTANTQMMKSVSLIIALLCYVVSFSQVGIGTTTPNQKSILDLQSTTKGLLIPRMTNTQRTSLGLSAADAGMMVFQTDVTGNSPKGLYSYDGSGWTIPLGNGISNGQTLRWDGNKWTPASNLFNGGSAIGIGTTSPNVQLQIHSFLAATTRLQITNGNANNLAGDGLLLGISNTNHAHIIQQEDKPLWFGTNNSERMRIDSLGNIGINNTQPAAKLDINGTVKIGQYGTPLTCIMRAEVLVDLPPIGGGLSQIINIPCPNVAENATVHISPGESLGEIMIAYARVSSPGDVEIKFTNLALSIIDEDETMFYLTIIQ